MEEKEKGNICDIGRYAMHVGDRGTVGGCVGEREMQGEGRGDKGDTSPYLASYLRLSSSKLSKPHCNYSFCTCA